MSLPSQPPRPEQRIGTEAKILRDDTSKARLRDLSPVIKGLLLLGTLLLAYFAYSSIVNHSRLNGWQQQAQQLTITVEQANAKIDSLNTEVNAKIKLANAAATKLQQSRNDLLSSESDVDLLLKRQRALANEKAKIEDQRAALVVVASSLNKAATKQQSCSSGLIDVLDGVLAENYTYVNSIIGSVERTCNSADQLLAQVQAQLK